MLASSPLMRKPTVRRLARACRPVIEALESRQLLSASTIQTLPFNLDFTSDRGDIADMNGLGTGFTLVQPNKLGTQYQPSLINLDTASGVLNLTTTGTSTAGSNTNADNTLVNGLETLFNATTSGFKITVRLKGPLNSIAAPSDQAGVMFGPDQDNFIKLVAISQPSGQVIQFADEESSNGTTFTHQVNQTVSIGSFSTISTLDLRLVGDASTGIVSAYYAVNGGAYVKLSKTVTLTGTFKSNFFSSAGTAGIIACAKNDLPPVTLQFDSFEIDAGQPVNAHPSVTASRPTNGDVGVSRDAFISADLKLTSPGATVDPSTLTSANVKLYRASDKLPIATILNLSGNGDALTATPTSLLDPNTTYTFQITAGLQDTSGATFTPYQMSFTTGSTGGAGNPSIAFQSPAHHRGRTGLHRRHHRPRRQSIRRHRSRTHSALHHQQRRHARRRAEHHQPDRSRRQRSPDQRHGVRSIIERQQHANLGRQHRPCDQQRQRFHHQDHQDLRLKPASRAGCGDQSAARHDQPLNESARLRP